MKIIKKLKVLVSLLTIFSLFSLTNVSAMEEKDKIINKNIYETEEKKEEIEKKQPEETDKKQNKDIYIDEEEKEEEKAIQKSSLEYKTSDYCFNIKTKEQNLNELKKKQTFQKSEKFIGLKTKQPDKNLFEKEQNNFEKKEIISKEELENLSKKFLGNFKNIDFDGLFKSIMNNFGYYGEKQRLKLGFPYISVKPYTYINVLDNGKKYNVPNLDFLKKLILDFNTKSSSLKKCFGSFDIFGSYYQYCFREGLDSSIFILDSNNEIREVDNGVLNKNFELFYDNLKDSGFEEVYSKNCEELIRMFLIQGYLKTFFISNYCTRYNFYCVDDSSRETLQQFSKIFSNAFKCEFDENGNLKAFDLDFSEVIKNEEDAKFLKFLYFVINKGGRSKKEKEVNLLYDLYVATYAFLKNKEFWNKIIKIIAFVNGYIAKLHNYNYDALDDKSISKDYFYLYCKNFDNNPYFKIMFGNIKENEKYFSYLYYKNIKDYDFSNLDERFKSTFLMFDTYRKKGFFDNGENNLGEMFNSEEYFLEDFSEIDDDVRKCLESCFNKRFVYSFKMPSNFKWLNNFFDVNKYLFKKNFGRVWFKLIRNDDFIVSAHVMLEYLDRAVRNEKIKEECLALVRCLFSIYLTKGFIAGHGNKADVTNVSILRLAEHFSNILYLRFEKNKFGKFILKLCFKKVNELNYNDKKIKDVIKKFSSKSDWENATEEDKMIYRLYLSALAFIKQEDFWNKFLAILVCDHGIDIAKNFYSDSRELYDEYKNLNNTLLNDNFFSKPENYSSNTIKTKNTKFLYYPFYVCNEDEILRSTNNLEDFSKFQKDVVCEGVQSDRIFIDYILDRGYNEIGGNNLIYADKSFDKIFFDLNKYKSNLLKILSENFAILNRILNGNCVEDFIKSLMEYGISSRYFYFLFDKFQNLLKNLCANFYTFIIGENINIDFNSIKEFDKNYYNYILNNKKIADEYISFIERFFNYYLKKLIFDKNIGNMFFDINPYAYNSENKLKLRDAKIISLRKIVNPMIEWYLRMFNAKVEDGKIKFKFDFKYVDDEVFSNIKNFFLKAFERYSDNMDILKNDNLFNKEANYCLKLKRFLYNVHVDAFAFLNSEDFWNNYISKMLFLNMVSCIKNKDKINNYYFKASNFNLDKEFLNVSEKIKIENVNRYEQLLNYLEKKL